MMYRGVLGLMALVVALLLVPAAAIEPGVASASLGDQRSFSAAELQRLEAGELVLRASTRRRGALRLMGGSSWQVIDAPPSVVWRALLDTRHYHKMMPRVIEAREVHRSDNVRTVFMRQGAAGLMETAYYLKVNIDASRRDITFVVDDKRPHDLKAAWGFYTVRPYPGAKTLLAYGIMADLGDGLITSLVRDSVHEWMLKTPWMVKRFLEGSGRNIYR